MTLDDLDAAFQSGTIDEQTMVLKAGSLQWMTLADVAGLDDAEPPSVAPQSSAYPYPASSAYPQSSPPPSSVYPQSSAHPQSSAYPYSMSATPSVYPSSPYAPPYSQSSGYFCEEPQPNSIAPIAVDLGHSSLSIPPLAPLNFDASYGADEVDAFKPKRNGARVVGMLAAVALVAGGLFAVNSLGTQGLKAKASSIASMVKGSAKSADARSVAVAPPAAMDPTPSPTFNANAPPMNNAKAVPIDSMPSSPTATPSSNASDKNGKKTKDAKKASKSGGGSGSSAKKAGAGSSASSDPTQKGSGQFDPLNGSL